MSTGLILMGSQESQALASAESARALFTNQDLTTARAVPTRKVLYLPKHTHHVLLHFGRSFRSKLCDTFT